MHETTKWDAHMPCMDCSGLQDGWMDVITKMTAVDLSQDDVSARIRAEEVSVRCVHLKSNRELLTSSANVCLGFVSLCKISHWPLMDKKESGVSRCDSGFASFFFFPSTSNFWVLNYLTSGASTPWLSTCKQIGAGWISAHNRRKKKKEENVALKCTWKIILLTLRLDRTRFVTYWIPEGAIFENWKKKDLNSKNK